MENLIKLDQNDQGVARCTLTRPDKRNALKRATLEQLSAAVDHVTAWPEARVLVLAAEGGVFCAGMDLGEMQERAQAADSQSEWQRDSEIYCDVLTKILSLPIPTVAAVSGPALAGGVGLVLACDLVVARDDAFFALPEPVRGITAAMVTPLLIRRVGAGSATSLLLSGERWTAARALATGLCHDVIAENEFETRIETLLQHILSGSRSALAITKQHIDRIAGAGLIEALRESMQVSATARETADAREGLQAFLEKRKPSWQT